MAQLTNKSLGAFIPTTQLWDTSEIFEANIKNDELKELLVRMYQNLNRMALSLNVKESAYYDTQEFVTGQQYFPAQATGELIDTTGGAGAAGGNVPGVSYILGQKFSIGNEWFVVIATGAPGVMSTTGGATTHTYDTTNGAYVFAGAQINTPVYFYADVISSDSSRQAYRQTTRKLIDFGGLPNTAARDVAHGIECTVDTVFTRIYGVATDPTGAFSYLPLPYSSPTLVDNIELSVDDTNVTITTGSDRTAYTVTYIVLEWLTH